MSRTSTLRATGGAVLALSLVAASAPSPAAFATSAERVRPTLVGGPSPFNDCDFDGNRCPTAEYGSPLEGTSGRLSYLVRKVLLLDAGYRDGSGLTSCNNERARLLGEARFMEAYVAAYEASGSYYFLRKLIDHASCVVKQRDDHRGVADYRGVSSARWRCFEYGVTAPYCWIYHSASICAPIAHAASIIIQDPNLHEVRFDDSSTLYDHAMILVSWVAETIADHEGDWDDVAGTYRFPEDIPLPQGYPHPGLILPPNMLASVGLVCLYMHDATGDELYLLRARGIAAYLYSILEEDDGAYWWSYWPDENPGRDNPDNLSHAGWVVAFAAAAAQRDIVFASHDMRMFASTYNDIVVLGETRVCNHIDGRHQCGPGDVWSPRWVSLMPWVGGEGVFRSTQTLGRHLLDLEQTTDNGVLEGLGYLARAEKWARLRGLSDSGIAGSEWAVVGAVDLDGDGIDEIVAAERQSGELRIYRFDFDSRKLLRTLLLSPGFGPASDWRGVGAVDLDADGREELIAARAFDGRVYLLGYFGDEPIADLEQYALLEVIATDRTWEGSRWAGLAVGEFDGENRLVVLLDEASGVLYLVEYDTELTPVIRDSLSMGANQAWIGPACGDLDGAAGDEIALARNADGDLYVVGVVGGRLAVATVDSGPGSDSQWRGLAIVDTDAGAPSELLLVRAFDGLLQRYELRQGELVGRDAIAFVGSTFSPGPLAGVSLDGPSRGDSVVYASDLTARVSILESAESAASHGCGADFDESGYVDSRDVLAFLNAWVAGDQSADFNRDGDVDSRDVLAFLNAWVAGC